MNINNRWFQLCASLLAMIMIANLQYAWTLFVPKLQGATSWKLSDIQFAFTLFILCQTWVQPLDASIDEMKGMKSAVPPPKPAAMMPEARPRRSLNHLSAEPIDPL